MATQADSKIYAVVITRNESRDSVKDTLASICGVCTGVILICDRNNESLTLYKDFHNLYSFCINKGREGRLTSTARNSGLSMVETFFKPKENDYILFADGDRKIVKGSLADIVGLYDIELLKVEQDFRSDEISYSERYGTVDNGFNSNGLIFKYSALKKLKAEFGYIFPTEVQSVWGIEDRCLGDMCYHCGLSAEYNPSIVQFGGYDRCYIDDDTFYRRLQWTIEEKKLRVKFNIKNYD